MVKAKLIAALVLIAVWLIAILQNTHPVETRFLATAVTMPLATLLAITMLLGIGVGILVAFGLSGRKPKKTESTHHPGADSKLYKP